MKVVVPLLITDANVYGTNAVESRTAWVSGTTYAMGDERKYNTSYPSATAIHRVYRRLTAGAGTTIPPLDAVNWLDIGPCNHWAAYDNSVSTRTTRTAATSADYLYMSMTMNADTDMVALFGLIGVSAVVEVWRVDAGPTPVLTSTATYALTGTAENPDQILASIAYPAGGITSPYVNIKVYGSSSALTTAIGVLAVGHALDLGATQYNPTLGIVSYSRKETDAFGIIAITKRAYSKRLTAKTQIDNANLDSVSRTLYTLDAVPCVWNASDVTNLKPLNVFGIFRDFSIDVAYPDTSLCSIEIESLT